jgi:hypothetical protein
LIRDWLFKKKDIWFKFGNWTAYYDFDDELSIRFFKNDLKIIDEEFFVWDKYNIESLN